MHCQYAVIPFTKRTGWGEGQGLFYCSEDPNPSVWTGSGGPTADGETEYKAQNKGEQQVHKGGLMGTGRRLAKMHRKAVKPTNGQKDGTYCP